MAKKNILIVEDEENILELIKYNLSKEGYSVDGISSGEKALRAVNSKEIQPDLIILDLMLPDLDGLEVCKRLKNGQSTSHIPVVMLTAKGEESDIITGLELGADDYITKPFSPKVLIARIRTILRREVQKSNTDSLEVIKIEDLIINPGRHEVSIKGMPIKLTSTEFQALYFLANKAGWVFTRYQIIGSVHGEEHDVTDRSIDVMIAGLRKKLGSYCDYIETVHGVGYRFKG